MKIKTTKRNADAILNRLGTNSKQIKAVGVCLNFYLYTDKEAYTASVRCLAEDNRFNRRERFDGVDKMQKMLNILDPADKNSACQVVADLVASSLDVAVAECNTFFCKLDGVEVCEMDRWVPIGGAVIDITITDQGEEDQSNG